MPVESTEQPSKRAVAASSGEHATPDYTAEIRFGVVMYRGVSLAIYINGVTNELFEMACATPRDGVRIVDENEPFTREIYRRVSWLVGSPELRQRYAHAIRQSALVSSGDITNDAWVDVALDDLTQTRLAVDVIAGTSAGGINGIFLAKALANGEQFGALKDLWVNEGDIALLLNDESSYKGTDPAIANRSDKPTSLLNSDRMYAKLQFALGQMRPLKGVIDLGSPQQSALADEIDLFVTTTDIKGSTVPLRLFDKGVYERRYKQSYHFSYPNGSTQPSGNDFDAANSPFLAFAARCTSSFPFAFEPMTLAALTRLDVAGPTPGVLPWNAFFPYAMGWTPRRSRGIGCCRLGLQSSGGVAGVVVPKQFKRPLKPYANRGGPRYSRLLFGHRENGGCLGEPSRAGGMSARTM